MKNQAIFSLKDKSKNLKCRLLQFLFGALRVNAALRPAFDSAARSSCFPYRQILSIRSQKFIGWS